jgi:hypothetical protein
MSPQERITILKRIQNILSDIVKETKGEVAYYDKLTKEVDKAVSEYRKSGKIPEAVTKSWVTNQKKLFSAYVELIDTMSL